MQQDNMEVPIPSAEATGKFFGGLLLSIAAGWALFKKYISPLLEKTEEESVEQPRVFKRESDAGYRILEERILQVERDFDKKIAAERTFLMGEIRSSEARVTDQVQEVGRRIDTHHQGINERLDIILGRIK